MPIRLARRTNMHTNVPGSTGSQPAETQHAASLPKLLRAIGALLVLLSLPALSVAQSKTPVDWVNPYIGTAGPGSDYGGAMPLVTTPFGMTNWTAQTRQNFISASSYNYGDTTISGFIGTHQPAIWMGDFGYVTIVPELDEIKTSPEGSKLKFTHADEQTTPYYYSVTMSA